MSIGPVTMQEQSNLLYRRGKIKGTDADFDESAYLAVKKIPGAKMMKRMDAANI